MSFSPIRRLGSLTTVLGITLLAAQAQATTYNWTAVANGNWSDSTKWDANGVPVSGATTSLTFADGGTYTATDDIATNPFVLNGLTFNNKTPNVVTLAGANPLNFVANAGTAPTITGLNGGNATIGQAIQLSVAGTATNLTVSNTAGTITFSNSVTDNSGLATGSNVFKTGAGTLAFAGTNGTTVSSFNQLSVRGGAVNITGGAVNLLAPNGTGGPQNAGNGTSGLQIGNANGDTGSVTVSGGANVVVSENVYLGDQAGSTGTLTVTGAGSSLSNAVGGQLSGRFAIGNYGNGTLNITNGGIVNAAFMLTNRNSGNSATILVDGVGSQLNTISALGGPGGGNLQIASNNSLGGAGNNSTATMTASNGAAVNIGGSLFVGGTAGNLGTVNVSGTGTTFTVTAFAIFGGGSAVSGTGNLNLSNGASFTCATLSFAGNGNSNGQSTAIVDHATLTSTNQLQIGSFTGEVGSLTIQNGGTYNSTGTAFIGAAFTGSTGGQGTLTVTGAGSTYTETGAIQLGTTPGGVGFLNVLNGGTATVSGNIFVGPAGAPPTTTGTLTVSGAGSTLTATGGNQALIISGGATPGGVGFLNVTNGGTVTVDNLTLTQNDGGTSTSTVSCGGRVVVNNQLLVGSGAAGGAGGTATLNINNGGQVFVGGNAFSGTVTVTGSINLSGFSSTLSALGQVQLGGSGGTAGAASVLTANAGSVVNLGDLILYGPGSVNANGGALGSFTVNDVRDGAAGTSVGTVAIGTGSTFTVNNTNSGFFQYSGAISGAGNFTKSGSGEEILTGSNSYTGTTNVNGGILGFGAASNLGTGAITFNGGTLQWLNNGSANTTDITAGPRTVTLNGSGGTFDTNFNTITLANPISGAGGLAVTGGGTVVLGGTNTYFGTTTVQNGNLVITADANLGSATGPLGGVNTVSGSPAGTLIVGGNGGVTTTRLFNMNGGTIAVSPASGTQTLTFNGSLVTGATLDATAGGSFATGTNGAAFNHVTTSASAAMVSNSVNDQFFNYTSNGTLTLAVPTTLAPRSFRNFNNQANGDGTFGTAGAGTANIPNGGLVIAGNATRGSQVNVSNFSSPGVLYIQQGGPADLSAPSELKNVGNTPLVFAAGSRTFVNDQLAAHASGPAFMDLNGQNAIVTGGLFVNNGNVFDSSAAGTAVVVADQGAVVKGAGFYSITPVTKNGGKYSPGNSPGRSFSGSTVFGPGGTQLFGFQINDAGPSTTFPAAPGVAGPIPNAQNQVSGWSLIVTQKRSVPVVTTGNFSWVATPSNKMNISMETLLANSGTPGYGTSGSDTDGPMSDFDPTKSYTWTIVQMDPAGTYSGPTDTATLTASTSLDVSAFANKDASNQPISASAFTIQWDAANRDLNIVYGTAVPEPGSMALLGAAGAGIGWVIRRRKAAKK
jgi:T5SS/PEP-CTERM-associated repeat protein/autotransporter-associated beta strand protein